MKISIIDTETTGLDPQKDFLIEVAVVNFDTEIKDVIDSKSVLINHDDLPDDPKEFAHHIHGIGLDLLRDYGHTKINAEGLVLNEVLRSDVVLAHNAEFDRQWFRGTGIHDMRWVCTQDDIEWPQHTGGKSLMAIAVAHGVPVISAHRALEDCLTIARLLKRVAELHDIDAMITRGLRPKAKFKALVGFADKDKAKAAGFRWDAEQRIWIRTMAIEDVPGLPFEVVRIAGDTNQATLFA